MLERGETDWDVEEWLGNMGLDEYVDVFVDNGYDIPNLVASMTNHDLDAMHIHDREHRKMMLKEATKIPKDKPPPKPKRAPKANVKKEAPDIKMQRQGLSRLQLKLKVGAELKSDKLEITAPPYSAAEGQADTAALLSLSRKYADKFNSKLEDTYDAIMDIWRSRKEAEVNLKSVFSPDIPTPVASPGVRGPTETYDEIFDLCAEKKPVRVRKKASTEQLPRPLSTSAQVSDISSASSPRSFSPEKQFEKLRSFLEAFDKSSFRPDSPPAKCFKFDNSEVWSGARSVDSSVKVELMTAFCRNELSSDQVLDKLIVLTASRKSSLNAFENEVVLRTPSVEVPVRKNGAIRTTSECSGDNSPKTSLARSTDSECSSPSGSPEVTRKKRKWERNGKVKETFMSLPDSEESSEDAKKDKEKKHSKSKFFTKVTNKLFKSRSKTKSTAEDLLTAEERRKLASITRAQSLPAIAGEHTDVVDNTFDNYSQPFDSIAPVGATVVQKDKPSASTSNIPARYNSKHVNTLPHDFSPSAMRKMGSGAKEGDSKGPPSERKVSAPGDRSLGTARLNGNTNCSADQEMGSCFSLVSGSSSVLRSDSFPDTGSDSMPEIPPRAYTPPLGEEEQVSIPPRQAVYRVTIDQTSSERQNSPSHCDSAKSTSRDSNGISPFAHKVSPRHTTPVPDLPTVTEEASVTFGEPPPKPRRHQRRVGTPSRDDLTSSLPSLLDAPSPTSDMPSPIRDTPSPISGTPSPIRDTPSSDLAREAYRLRSQSSPKPEIARKPSKLKRMMERKAAAGDPTGVGCTSGGVSTITTDGSPSNQSATTTTTTTRNSTTAECREPSAFSPTGPTVQSTTVTVNVRRVKSPNRPAPPLPPHRIGKQRTAFSESTPSFYSDDLLPKTMLRSATYGQGIGPSPLPRSRALTPPTGPTIVRLTQAKESPVFPQKQRRAAMKRIKSRSLENLLDLSDEMREPIKVDADLVRPPLPPKPVIVPPKPPKPAHLQQLVRPTSDVPSSWRDQSQAEGSSVGNADNVRPWRTPPPRRSPISQNGLGKLVTKPVPPPKHFLRMKSPPPEEREAAMSSLKKKLKEESICLSDPPYSTDNGRCGVPLMMAKRYSTELGLSLELTVECLDFIRLDLLQSLNKPACSVSAEYWKSVPVVGMTSVNDWLVSIGLPFYKSSLAEANIVSIHDIPTISALHIKIMDLKDPWHKDLIQEGIKHYVAQITQNR